MSEKKLAVTTDTLRGMARLMRQQSDEPDDLQGLRAAAVEWAAARIDELEAEHASIPIGPPPGWVTGETP